MEFSCDSQIALLGYTDRISEHVNDAGFVFQNIIGLTNMVGAYVFPMQLGGSFIFAIRPDSLHSTFDMTVRDEQDATLATIKLDLTQSVANPLPNAETSTPSTPRAITSRLTLQDCWTVIPIRLQHDHPPLILKPGKVAVIRKVEDQTTHVGAFYVGLAPLVELTPDRISAIKASPTASKAVRLRLGCKTCSSELEAYAGLERNSKWEAESVIWYSELPGQFECSCGNTKFDLQYIQRNLPSMIGQDHHGSTQYSFVPYYEKGAIQNVLTNYRAVLESASTEEDLQRFFESNPILFHQFPARQIIHKPNILGLRRADFAIVTHKHELLLIELERHDTRIMKADGGMASELQHAFDQVHDWLQMIADHKQAVLAGMKISPDLVTKVVGLVIAGRDSTYDREKLRLLKGRHSHVAFQTYDDILVAMGLLAGNVSAL